MTPNRSDSENQTVHLSSSSSTNSSICAPVASNGNLHEGPSANLGQVEDNVEKLNASCSICKLLGPDLLRAMQQDEVSDPTLLSQISSKLKQLSETPKREQSCKEFALFLSRIEKQVHLLGNEMDQRKQRVAEVRSQLDRLNFEVSHDQSNQSM